MFGDRLKQLRKSRGVTQVKLAESLNLDKSSIAKYEVSGVMPSPEVLIQLAKFFNVSADVLLGIERPEPAPPPEPEIVRAYNDASPEIQAAVRKLLDM